MSKPNACIAYISSRDKCIEHSLKSLWDMYNKDHNYPVYVHYFDDIYDSEELQNKITKHNEQNVIFKEVPYSTPSFIPEPQLFYNRRNLWYARNSFPISRKGYLHMCNFTSNMYGYENTELSKYNYVMTHDDEAGYEKLMEIDPFEIMSRQKEYIGAYYVKQRLKDGHPHQGHKDTRVGLWNFTKNFLLENNITPASKVLQDLLEDPEAETKYHYIKWCDTYVIKTTMFKSELWNKWINAVNESGGIYKYRWGDNEIISLFAYIIQEEIYNLNLIDNGMHNQGMFRHIQGYAPSVKDTTK